MGHLPLIVVLLILYAASFVLLVSGLSSHPWGKGFFDRVLGTSGMVAFGLALFYVGERLI